MYDDIDRALFALPLEVPPLGLRSAVLAATVHAPAPARVMAPAFSSLGAWESLGVGVALALGVWLTLAVLFSPPFAQSIAESLQRLVLALADPTLLAWLAAGGCAAFLLNFGAPRLLRVPVRTHRP